MTVKRGRHWLISSNTQVYVLKRSGREQYGVKRSERQMRRSKRVKKTPYSICK